MIRERLAIKKSASLKENTGKVDRSDYRSESRKRMIRRVLQLLPRYIALILILLAIFLLATRSSIFQLKEIEVNYIGQLPAIYVDQEALEIDLNDKYLLQNYFRTDPRVIQNELLLGSVHIKQVIVSKVFPDRLEVQIIVREPFLIVEHLEECYLIDPENVLLEKASINSGVENGSSHDDKEENGSSNDEITTNTAELANEDGTDDCTIMKGLTVPLRVNVTDTSIQNIFSRGSFIYFEQLYLLDGLFSDQGYTIETINVRSDGSIISLSNDKRVLIDLDDTFDEQVKRLVLIMAQIEIDRPDFGELDVRYKRPVLRK